MFGMKGRSAVESQKVSESPTRPKPASSNAKIFDIAELYQGPVAQLETGEGPTTALELDEKLRQAYFWIVNNAIISPF